MELRWIAIKGAFSWQIQLANCRVQKFTANGKLLKKIDIKGDGEFSECYPRGKH